MTEFFNQLICPKTHTKLVLSADGKTLSNTSKEEPISYDIYANGIVDMVYPKELFEQDRKEQVAYNDAYLRYDRGVSWVFESLRANEAATRKQMMSHLKLKKGMKVLEVGAGTGKDSALIIDRITPNGHAVLSDLSPAMLGYAKEKLADKKDVKIDYFVGNGSYLPFEDNTFDALFHFGGINTFAERKKAFEEFARVVKVGGRIVVGDESTAPWLRDQKTYQILMDANPMFADTVPLEDLPKNVKDVRLEWIFGNAFYVLSFRKLKKAPTVNVNLQIPNKTEKDNWRLRAIKNRKK